MRSGQNPRTGGFFCEANPTPWDHVPTTLGRLRTAKSCDGVLTHLRYLLGVSGACSVERLDTRDLDAVARGQSPRPVVAHSGGLTGGGSCYAMHGSSEPSGFDFGRTSSHRNARTALKLRLRPVMPSNEGSDGEVSASFIEPLNEDTRVNLVGVCAKLSLRSRL